jgi:putative exporter of polyketide antibiotics
VQRLSSNRATTRRYVVLAAVQMIAVPGTLLAESASCSANNTSLSCRLQGVLHWLEAVAWVLAVLLVLVVGIAIHLLRKNRLSRKGGR